MLLIALLVRTRAISCSKSKEYKPSSLEKVLGPHIYSDEDKTSLLM